MNRIISLDVLRGLAIIIMIFVDFAPFEIYPIFRHAEWEGMTIADTAFPMFAFTMGTAAAVSVGGKKTSLQKIFRRASLLFAAGILFNSLPFIFGLFLNGNFSDENFFAGFIETFRPLGILQRLAAAYLFGMLIVKFCRRDRQIIFSAFVLLVFYSASFHIFLPEKLW